MKNNLSIRVVKWLMKRYPNILDKNDLSIWEIFKHEDYIEATEEKQNAIKLESAKYRYDREPEYLFFDMYFPNFPTKRLCGKTVLDLGCFTSGRIVYWKERYKFGETHGIDINPIFEQAGRLFAHNKGIDIKFRTGYGENLPYEKNYFDLIISYDVFEHVRDVEKVMEECFRILKPGGRLFLVFPQYLQPLCSHLDVTKLPCLHWFFSGSTITKAAYDVYIERGRDAYWYARKSPKLEEWEKLPSLNGISIFKFRQIICKKSWKIIYQNKRPILAGKTAQQRLPNILFQFIRHFLGIFACIPFLEELFLNRVVFILEKNHSKSII